MNLYGSVRVPKNIKAGSTRISLEFFDWKAGQVDATSVEVETLPAIPLASRRPISDRMGRKMIHPDRNMMVSAVKISPDGSKVFGSNYPNNNIQIWESATGKQLGLIETPYESKSSQHFWLPNKDFSRFYAWVESRGNYQRIEKDGKHGTQVSYPESAIQVWDSNGKIVDTIQGDPPNQFRFLQMSPDGRYLLTLENLSGTYFGDRALGTNIYDCKTKRWVPCDVELGAHLVFCKTTQRIANFTYDETNRYIKGLSIRKFPSCEQISQIDFGDGVMGSQHLAFINGGKHLLAAIRIYPRKNIWNKWQTKVLCFETATGKKLGQYDFPYDNDSPRFCDQQFSNGALVLNTWRKNPKQAISLSTPDLKQKWTLDLGEYAFVGSMAMPKHRNWLAAICIPKSSALETRDVKNIDWDLVHQNELKMISKNGKLLETMVLPVGASHLEFGTDDHRAVLGALGAVYEVDFSKPFSNK